MSQLNIRQKIIDKWLQNPSLSHKSIAKEFKMKRYSVSRIIKRFFELQTVERKKKENSFKGARNSNLDSTIVRTIKANRSMSVRDVGKKCRTSSTMVQRGKSRAGLKTYKKQKIPKVTEKQKSVIKTRSRKLSEYSNRENVHFVLDDETYIKADFNTLPGPQYYTKSKGETLPEHQTTIGQEKFGPKFLIWQAICECGLRSQAYVVQGTLKTDQYIKEMLKKRLLPFIRKHNERCLFWPDLAPSHYAKNTQKFMRENGIHFVEKNMNPPNVPQCRPIERYWALVKAELRKTGKTAKDEKEFLKMYNEAARKIPRETVANLMSSMRRNLRAQWEN
jgi:hypothetical protein